VKELFIELISEVLSSPYFFQIVLLLSLIALFVSWFILFNYKSHQIVQYYRARLLDYVDDVLYRIYSISSSRLEKYIEDNYDSYTSCAIKKIECQPSINEKQHLITIGKQMLYEVIVNRTRFRIKTALWRNGFYNMSEERRRQYIKDTAIRLRNKNLYNLREMGFYNYDIFLKTDSIRLTEKEAIKFYGKIIEEAVTLKKEQNKEIKNLLLVLPTILDKFFLFMERKHDEK